MSIGRLRDLLARLDGTLRVQSLASLVCSGDEAAGRAAGSRPDERPRAALGVEGGCLCQAQYALPLLKAMALPHTLFLNPSRLGGAGFMTRGDVLVLLREGTGLGALWDANEPLDGLGTVEAAWNLELMAHGVLGLLASQGPSRHDPWLAVASGKGDDRLIALARAAGFGGIAATGERSGPNGLERRCLGGPLRGGRGWRPKSARSFQGVCPAGR
jgi:hypothetical protein